MVVGRCDCGCPTIDLAIDRSMAPRSPRPRTPVLPADRGSRPRPGPPPAHLLRAGWVAPDARTGLRRPAAAHRVSRSAGMADHHLAAAAWTRGSRRSGPSSYCHVPHRRAAAINTAGDTAVASRGWPLTLRASVMETKSSPSILNPRGTTCGRPSVRVHRRRRRDAHAEAGPRPAMPIHVQQRGTHLQGRPAGVITTYAGNGTTELDRLGTVRAASSSRRRPNGAAAVDMAAGCHIASDGPIALRLAGRARVLDRLEGLLGLVGRAAFALTSIPELAHCGLLVGSVRAAWQRAFRRFWRRSRSAPCR